MARYVRLLSDRASPCHAIMAYNSSEKLVLNRPGSMYDADDGNISKTENNYFMQNQRASTKGTLGSAQAHQAVQLCRPCRS